MNTIIAARTLVKHIDELPDFLFVTRRGPSYQHVGAILSDTVLQAGLNYHSVVEPRIRRILELYCEARTLPDFASLLHEIGANIVLQWQHHEKPNRLNALTKFFGDRGLVTHNDFGNWMRVPENRIELLGVRGVGPKSVDYLSGLLGIDAVAVDRHLQNFVRHAGVSDHDYDFVKSTVSFAADLLGVSRRSLDFSIWSYQADRS